MNNIEKTMKHNTNQWNTTQTHWNTMNNYEQKNNWKDDENAQLGQRDIGQGMMTGSNRLWAQGPTNLFMALGF